MSLILEALRKSEAERRLGRAPDLLSPDPIAASRRRGPRWPLWLGALVLVALVAGGGWWLGRRAVPSPAPAVAVDAIAPGSGGGEVGASLLANQPPAVASKLAPTSLPPPAVASKLAPTSLPPPAVASKLAPTLLPPPAVASKPAPAPVSPVAEGPASPEALQALRERLERTARTGDTEPTAPKPAAPKPAAGEPFAPVASALDPPSLSSMPAAQRGALPPLKLTLHVYAADPAARFVILDGRRLGEGTWLTEGLRLAEIRRDGVRLEIEGRPWLLPRP